MPIRLMGLVDLKPVGNFITGEGLKEDNFDSMSPPAGDNASVERDADIENENINAHLMRLNKQAAEVYDLLGDNDDVEPWVKEKVKQAVDCINSVHGHLTYDKERPDQLRPRPEKPDFNNTSDQY